MTDWRHSRYGLSAPKPFAQKLERAYQIVMRNKMNIAILLLAYTVCEVMGKAAILATQWSLSGGPPSSNYHVLIQLTANVPAHAFHAILNAAVLWVIMCAIKRKGHKLNLLDVTGLLKMDPKKIIVGIIFSDLILSSPLAVAQTLVRKDLVLALIYLMFAFFLNWMFGLAPLLMLEDQNIPLMTAHIWSSAAALMPATFSCVIVSSLTVFFGTPLLIFTPILLVLEVLTFYEVFGYSSPAEVQLTTEGN